MFSMNFVFGILLGIGGLALAVMAGLLLYEEPKRSERQSLQKGAVEPRTT